MTNPIENGFFYNEPPPGFPTSNCPREGGKVAIWHVMTSFYRVFPHQTVLVKEEKWPFDM
jgi:hypothetical protein